MKRRWYLKQLPFPKVIAVVAFAILAIIIVGCSSCEGDRHEHVFGAPFSKQVNTEANCTITVQTCYCGHEEVIASSAHQYTADEPSVVYENNKAKGYTVKYTCTVCEYYSIQWLNDEQIKAYGLTPVEELNRVHYWTTTESPCTEDEYLAYLIANNKVDNVPVDEGMMACYYKVVRTCSDCDVTETVVMRRDEPDPDYVPPEDIIPPDEPGDVTDPEPDPEPEPEPDPIPEPTPGTTTCEHIYETRKVAPTCNGKGYTEYVCTKCDKSYTSDYINPTGHKYGDWQIKNATCTADGVKTRECSSCGHKEKQSIASTGHKYGSWTTTKAATCVTAGTKTQTCSSCGDTKKQTINATGHNYSSWKTTKAATCELSGTKESTCANCGHTKTESIAATGHAWDEGKDIVVSTNCSDVGSRRYTCTKCNKKRLEQIKGTHTFGEWIWEDAVIQSGPDKGDPTSKKYHVCSKCNYKEYGNVPEHYCRIYCNGNDKYTIKGTCIIPNVRVETCRTCSREWRYELGYGPHSWKSETKHLTDYTEYTNELDVEISTCTACGKKSCSYTKGKGWTRYETDAYNISFNISSDDVYAPESPRADTFELVEHPTWQTVTRNFKFNSSGLLTEYTIYWHDKNGKRHSNVVVIADIPKMFENAGYEIPTGVSQWTYGLMLCVGYDGKGILVPDHISYSG